MGQDASHAQNMYSVPAAYLPAPAPVHVQRADDMSANGVDPSARRGDVCRADAMLQIQFRIVYSEPLSNLRKNHRDLTVP